MNAEKRSIPPKVLLQLLAAVTCSVAVVLLPLNVKAAENNVLPAISSTEQQSDVIANGKENGISWSVTSDGLLTLTTESGVSTIKNYDYNETYTYIKPLFRCALLINGGLLSLSPFLSVWRRLIRRDKVHAAISAYDADFFG